MSTIDSAEAYLLDTQMDPTTLARVMDRFDAVPFVTVPWVDLDPCSGCLTHPACEPLASEAVIVYRRGNHTYPQPVGPCCLQQELSDILNSRTPVEWIRVEVPLFATKAVTA